MINKKIIVVGGGTSGAIVCKRLAEHSSIIVFEKSKYREMPILYKVPIFIGILFSKHSKYLKRIQLRFDEKRTVPLYESNILGGASVINGCVHVLGIREKWDELLFKFNLTIEDLQLSYRSLYTKKNDKNKISLRKSQKSSIDSVFFQALRQQSIIESNSEWMNGASVGSIYNTVGRFFRSSVMDLKPFRGVVVKMGSEVDCLVIDGNKTVIGVMSGNKIYCADHIILCSGVIGTNVLLKRKGYSATLNDYVDLGIPAGIGIKDHTNLRVNVRSVKPLKSLNEIYTSYSMQLLLFLKHILGFKSLMMGTGATSYAHLDIDGDGVVDTRINLLNFYETGRSGSEGPIFSSSLPGFSISITAINPISSGEITIEDGVKVTPNYLDKNFDINHLKKALDFVISLLSTDDFKSMNIGIEDLDQIKKNPEDFIRQNSFSGYHLIGGTAHIVSNKFELLGYKGIYICDASVMSSFVSSNIHSSVVLLADMFSRKFLRNVSAMNA